jgi:hypothetical protein
MDLANDPWNSLLISGPQTGILFPLLAFNI